MAEKKPYEVFDYDSLLPGRELKIQRTVYYSKYDVSDLTQQPAELLRDIYADSAAQEDRAFQTAKEAAAAWEKHAANTQRIRRALDYVTTPVPAHSGNHWTEDNHGWRTISNMVYKMACRLREAERWNRRQLKWEPCWEVEWWLRTNGSRKDYNVRLAGQEKSFADKAAAEKYLSGRIKAYAKLFTELSPPIPAEQAERFTVSIQLLPGYRIEGAEPEQAKPSVMEKLSAAKTESKTMPVPEPSQKASRPER